ncbi:hypothetical protein PSACC_02151 [Paramicrosporidium saccamoebae]|uniref:60S ribosomal export protein NMD3 n=1 Tax=Paramicrosporidium saccamoebae TaxID=1246581 RepID=A0A2H9TJT4_9FUNG|nr:hypothetical protein PSACC_02151 [Paramicrosporidium saccamoebae]
MSHEYIPTTTTQRILCCECGVAIEPNAANMCLNCIRSRVDITEGIPKQIVVNFCRGCERYLAPPAQWLPCALESKELLSLLLKRMKGLSKVRLIDAGFVWTEPHSKRIKVKLTIQKEAFAATILQQTFVVEAVVANQQCSDCARREAKNTWNTVVQVRQKVEHKRTFLYLEQLILKHQAHRDTVNIKTVREGIDFFFDSRSHAIKFVDFLQAVVPARSKSSEQLITQDVHSGESTYKFTFSVEIVPICKDDLVFLPGKTARHLGGVNPIVLCTRVGTTLHFVEPTALAKADIPTHLYWRDPFLSLAATNDLVEFYVLDVETGRSSGKNCFADVQVARASDFGRNTQSFHCRTHLGFILKPGDVVLGYDLSTSNFNNVEFTEYTIRHEIPDVILVRKSYDHLRRSGKRKWKLKQLAMDVDEMEPARGTPTDRDYERFMQELEEDQEMRSAINLYRQPQTAAMDIISDVEDVEVPRVSLEELLEELVIE